MTFVGRSSEDATERERERVDVSSSATLTTSTSTITSPDEPKPSVPGDRRAAPQREREKDNKEDGVLCALCSLLFPLCCLFVVPSEAEGEGEGEAQVETAARKSSIV